MRKESFGLMLGAAVLGGLTVAMANQGLTARAVYAQSSHSREDRAGREIRSRGPGRQGAGADRPD